MGDNVGTTQTQNSGSSSANRQYDPGVMGLSQQLAARGLQSPEALATLQQNAMARQNDTVWGAQLTNSRNAVANMASGHDAWQPTQGLQDFASGKYLSPESNPWLKGAYDDAANAGMSQMRGQFAGAGRYGSGAMAATQGDMLNKLGNTFYGNAYNAGMQNMFGANTAINQGHLQSKNQQLAASALLPSAGIGNDAQLMQLAGLQQGAINGQYSGIANLLGQSLTGTTGMNSGSNQTPYYAPNDFQQALGGIGGALNIATQLGNIGGGWGNIASGAKDLFSGWGSYGATVGDAGSGYGWGDVGSPDFFTGFGGDAS